MNEHQKITFPFHAKNSAFLAHNLKENGFDISVKFDAETNFKHTIATADKRNFNSVNDLGIKCFGVPLISQNINSGEIIKEEVFVLGKIREVEAGSTTNAVANSGNLKGFALQVAEPDSYFTQKNELQDARSGAAHKPWGSDGWIPNEPQHRSQLAGMANENLGTFSKEKGFVPDFEAIKDNPEALNNLTTSQLSTLHSACLIEMEANYLVNKESLGDEAAMQAAEECLAGEALGSVKDKYSEKLSVLETSVTAHEERYATLQAEREDVKTEHNHGNSKQVETEAAA